MLGGQHRGGDADADDDGGKGEESRARADRGGAAREVSREEVRTNGGAERRLRGLGIGDGGLGFTVGVLACPFIPRCFKICEKNRTAENG